MWLAHMSGAAVRQGLGGPAPHRADARSVSARRRAPPLPTAAGKTLNPGKPSCRHGQVQRLVRPIILDVPSLLIPSKIRLLWPRTLEQPAMLYQNRCGESR